MSKISKKIVIIVLAIVALLLIVNFTIINPINTENKVTVGSTNFILPEGYIQGDTNTFDAVNITNGTNTVFISESDDDNITKVVRSYRKNIENKGQTMTVDRFHMDNYIFYKTNNVDNPGNIHYFFEKNNKVYDVYCWDGNADLGSIALELAKSEF